MILMTLGQSGKFQHIRITDNISHSLLFINSLHPSGFYHGFFIRGEPCPFIKKRTDLPLKLALGPIAF
jgi:hypothetical protein